VAHAEEVKSPSPTDRLWIAFSSPGGIEETGLPDQQAEKTPQIAPLSAAFDIFSGPV